MEWFKTRIKEGITEVFDPIRKKYYVLTPEEEVRQLTLRWLVETLNYPAGLIGVEYAFTLNKLKKRSDIVVFSNNGKALLIVECKARHIPITQKVLDQAVRYNMTLKVEYLVLTNADHTYILQIKDHQDDITYLEQLPDYNEISR